MNLQSPNRSTNKTPGFRTPGKSSQKKSTMQISPRSVDKKRNNLVSQLEIMIKMNA